MGRVKKPKKATIAFIEREKDGQVAAPYRIMERLIASKRADLAEAQIGLAWRIGWKRDKDGLLKCGKCCKRNELDRNLSRFDFVILLNAEAWSTFTARQQERLIFHELEHAQIVTEDDMPKRDEKGRLVTRCKKHDIQDFRSVVEAYGWDEDLSDLAVKGIADAGRPLLKAIEEKQTPPEAELPAGSPAEPGAPIRIPIRAPKKFGLTGAIVLTPQGSGWSATYEVTAGRCDLKRQDVALDGEPEDGTFATPQQAADAMAVELCERLESLTESEYALAGAACKYVKDTVKKWINATPEA